MTLPLTRQPHLAEDLYEEKLALKRDQALLSQQWNVAVDPEAAEWEERAWMRDETFGVLTDIEERVRTIQQDEVNPVSMASTLRPRP